MSPKKARKEQTLQKKQKKKRGYRSFCDGHQENKSCVALRDPSLQANGKRLVSPWTRIRVAAPPCINRRLKSDFLSPRQRPRKAKKSQTSCCKGVFFPLKYSPRVPTSNFHFYAGRCRTIGTQAEGARYENRAEFCRFHKRGLLPSPPVEPTILMPCTSLGQIPFLWVGCQGLPRGHSRLSYNWSDEMSTMTL